MSKMQTKKYLWLIALSFLTTLCCGCNPIYILRAGITQSEILWNRKDIDQALKDPDISPEISRKLRLILSARAFAEKIGLTPGGSFKSYSKLDRDTLAWIVLAAKPDSFEFYTWWFPIVGSVPYKGFFSIEAAHREAKSLQMDGYETLVRGTEAFSTLGWFDDPIMTPMLKNDDHEIVGTVLHEILHTTLWIPDHVSFNESLANFIGLKGAASYYQELLLSSSIPSAKELSTLNGQLLASVNQLLQAIEISRTISLLVPELTTLYQSSETRETKLLARESIFQRHIMPLKSKYPTLKILSRAHNAELMQLQLYYTKLDLFQKLWDNQGGKWTAFLELIRKIALETEALSADPFEIALNHLDKLSKNQPASRNEP